MQVDAIHLSLGVEGFKVMACDERDGAIEVAIETIAPLACCPSCGHAEIVAKERKPLWVRDLPLRPGKQTWLIWWKRRFSLHQVQEHLHRDPRRDPAALHSHEPLRRLPVSASDRDTATRRWPRKWGDLLPRR